MSRPLRVLVADDHREARMLIVRIVAVSGYDDGEAERIMRAAGASTFFSKRVMLEELVGFFETFHRERCKR